MNTNAPVFVLGAISLLVLISDGQIAHAGSTTAISSQPFGRAANALDHFPAFSAEYDLHTQSTSSVSVVTMSGRVARQDRNWRLEMDMGKMLTNGPLASPFLGDSPVPDVLDSLTNLSVTLVWRPDKKVLWRSCSFPGTGIEGYFEEPLRNVAREGTNYSVRTSELGAQTVGDHAAIIHQLTFTDQTGGSESYTVWNATDLEGFPIRIQWVEHTTTNILMFKHVSLTRPDSALFEPPASKRYSPATLMLDALKAIGKERAPADKR